jgi:hypothetical protein
MQPSAIYVRQLGQVDTRFLNKWAKIYQETDKVCFFLRTSGLPGRIFAVLHAGTRHGKVWVQLEVIRESDGTKHTLWHELTDRDEISTGWH